MRGLGARSCSAPDFSGSRPSSRTDSRNWRCLMSLTRLAFLALPSSTLARKIALRAEPPLYFAAAAKAAQRFLPSGS